MHSVPLVFILIGVNGNGHDTVAVILGNGLEFFSVLVEVAIFL